MWGWASSTQKSALPTTILSFTDSRFGVSKYHTVRQLAHPIGLKLLLELLTHCLGSKREKGWKYCHNWHNNLLCSEVWPSFHNETAVHPVICLSSCSLSARTLPDSLWTADQLQLCTLLVFVYRLLGRLHCSRNCPKFGACNQVSYTG